MAFSGSALRDISHNQYATSHDSIFDDRSIRTSDRHFLTIAAIEDVFVQPQPDASFEDLKGGENRANLS